MKNFLLSAAIALSAAVYGQVGINTTSPKATFEVNGQPTVATVPDGVIPPQLTREQLIAKTAYSTNQKGAMVYVTDTSGTTNTATTKVDKPGFYYFDGTAWQKVAGDDWSLTGNAGTDPTVNFIGTTDAKRLNFRWKNWPSGFIDGPLAGFGFQSLMNNTTGNFNTAYGAQTLTNNKTGSHNTAVGWNAL